MEVTIRPNSSHTLKVEMPGQQVEIPAENGPAMMEHLQGQATVKVFLRGAGFILNAENLKAALELAGLTSFAAAKATSQGFVEL